MTPSRIIWIALAGILIYIGTAGLRMRALIEKGKQVAENSKAFERKLPNSQRTLLFVGDSTAQGTGAATPEESVAGRFGAKYPDATVLNKGRNGKRLSELKRELMEMEKAQSDLLVIMIGGNDITHLTKLSEVRSDLEAVLTKAREISPRIVVVHSGNIGASPLFPWPINVLLTERTRKVRDIYISTTAKHGATYVDLFAERIDDEFLKDPEKYYLSDMFHPSSEGYALWFQKIEEAMKRDEITF